MFRPARPTLHWLLWLVIALLPLRGWAMAQMAVAPVPAHAPASQSHHAAHGTPSPCHAAAAATSKATPAHAGCSLCEVCHAGMGGPVVVVLHLPTLPHAAPVATPLTGMRDGPPGELFRPPRPTA